MFTHLCKLFHQLHSRPKTMLLLALAATALALLSLRDLAVKTTLSDLLPQDFRSVSLLRRIQAKFGGLGHLVVVVRSEDSAASGAAVRFLAERLRGHPDVNFLEYRTEADFYRAHKLLYIRLKDLQEIEKRVEAGFWLSREKENPLIIDLLNEEEKESSLAANTNFEDLERKYFSRLQDYLGTPDGKVRILRIYPDFDITDIPRCRALKADVDLVADELRRSGGSAPEILYTGQVMRNIQNEGKLFTQVINSGLRSLYLIAFLLLAYFIRVPLGAALALAPLAMGIIWTLALTKYLVGYLSFITASLGLLLVGIGLDAAIHLLSRYQEERRKGLGAAVAFETIVLETGPAIATGALISAAAFLTLLATRFKGFEEFGLMAGLGLLCTLAAVMVVFPCLLILIEPLGLIPVFGTRIHNLHPFKARPYRHWRLHLALLVLVTAACCWRGLQYHFQFNLDRLSFPNRNLRADSLLQAAGEAIAEPAVVLTPDAAEAERVADRLRAHQAEDTLTPTIQEVTTMTDLLPADQGEKLAIIARLKQIVTPRILARASGPMRENLRKLEEAWNERRLDVADLPENYKRKFYGKDSSTGQFTFIFPSVDLRQGWNAIAFAEDVRAIRVDPATTYYASGDDIVKADLMGLIIPGTVRTLVLALVTIILLVWADVKSLRATRLISVPMLLGLAWTLGAMKVLGIRLNHFNLVAFPATVVFGMVHSLHLYHRYLEEGRGSLFYVLRRAGQPILASYLAGMASFIALAFSEHRGLASLGRTAAIGLTMSLLAPLVYMPLLIGYFEGKNGDAPGPVRSP